VQNEATHEQVVAGLIETVKGKGRAISSTGQKFIDNTAHEVLQDIIMDNPELGKY
jgi:ribosomal protein S19E (S16A)